jgi:hypothetical protein
MPPPQFPGHGHAYDPPAEDEEVGGGGHGLVFLEWLGLSLVAAWSATGMASIGP